MQCFQKANEIVKLRGGPGVRIFSLFVWLVAGADLLADD
jgi:hypothetical protein